METTIGCAVSTPTSRHLAAVRPWFVLGAIAGGALLGGAVGSLGRGGPTFIWEGLPTLFIVGVLVALDLVFRPVGLKRQVSSALSGRSPSIRGLTWGLQIGAGLPVFVNTWALWALITATFLLGSIPLGLLYGATYGLIRGLQPYASSIGRRRWSVTLFRLDGRFHGPLILATILVSASII